MHNRTQFVITAGATSVSLGATFKELSAEKSPITYTNPTSGISVPVEVKSREEIERSGIFLVAPYFTPRPNTLPISYVFLEQNGSGWTLNTPAQFPNSTDITYNVSGYFFPSALALGTDTNFITNDGDLAEALVNRMRHLAYFAEDPTDARAAASLQAYEEHYKRAAIADERRKLGGRAVRW